MSQLYEDKNPLEDKRDENFIQLKSTTYFYEMFKKKNQKSSEVIPQTILWESGNPNTWFFNTSKGKVPQILHKNTDKVNHFEICKFFFGISRPEELRIDNLTSLSEYSKKIHQKEPVCFIRYVDKKTEALIGPDLVKLFLESKQTANISMIQSYVPNNSKANEVFYVEYRHDENSLPLGFKFYKKIFSTKKGYTTSQEQLNNNENKDQNMGGQGKKESIIKGKKLFFKCFDQSLNVKLQESSKRLIEFIERAYKLKVRKFTPKYMLDRNGNIIFMGIKHLFIELFSYAPYDIEQIKEQKQMTFQEFRKLYKKQKKHNLVKVGGVEMKLPQFIQQDDKKYSATLYKKMRVEKCGGDFCDYEMLEKNTGPLAMRKNILEEYKKHFGVRKEQLENIAISLPYEISNQLILRTREYALQVIEILRKNKIFSKESQIVKSQNYHYTNEDNFGNIDIEVEYPFMKKSYTVDNYENQYKRVKICKSCFIIYSLTSKYFDEKLKEKMRQTQLRQYLTRQSSANQFQTIQFNQNNEQEGQAGAGDPINQKNSIKDESNAKELLKSQSQVIIKQKSVDPKRQNQFKISKSSKISLNAREDQQIPDQSQYFAKTTTKARLLPNTRKDIEVNRLTLGFLNYEKLRDLYKEPADSKIKSQILNETKVYKKPIVNLLEKPSKDMKRKDINADSYLLFKIAEDRKNLRRNINSDSQMRQVLLNKLQIAQQEGQKPALIQINSLYYNHANFQHLRKLHKFKISSPINPFFDDLDIDKIQELTIEKVCDIMGYQEPIIDSSDMKFLVIDESTAIPYCLIGGEKQKNQEIKQEDDINDNKSKNDQNYNISEQLNEFDSPYKKQSRNRENSQHNIEKNNEIIVFLQDFFDSYFEYKSLFESFLQQNPNRRVLLFNLPGQSYTIYNSELLYPNYYQIEVIDRLLFKLDQEKLINTKTDKFKFIGIGYGGFILQSYMVSAYGNLPHLGSLLLINSFIEVDNILKDTLLKSLEIFETCPEGMDELSFNYFSVIVNSQALSEEQLSMKMKINPILNEGRAAIIKGCLASQFMRDRFEKVPVSCLIVHTLKNCVVNINQSDLLAKYTKDEVQDFQANLILKKINEKQVKRKTKYINGGHSLLEENVEQLLELINEFLREQF
ncbi:hypothetical protein ABPG72_000816 [Tetrahymena utriculariae]